MGPSHGGVKQLCGRAAVRACSGAVGVLGRASAKFLHVRPDARTDGATH